MSGGSRQGVDAAVREQDGDGPRAWGGLSDSGYTGQNELHNDLGVAMRNWRQQDKTTHSNIMEWWVARGAGLKGKDNQRRDSWLVRSYR